MPDAGNAYDDLYDEAGYKYNIDPLRLKAHAIQESGEDPTRTGASGEYGMMQIMPDTAKMLGLSKADAYKPGPAIDAAARYLSLIDAQHTDRNGNLDLDASTAAYNGRGPAATNYAGLVRDIYGQLQQQGGLKLSKAHQDATKGPQGGQSAPVDDPFSQTLKAPTTPPDAAPAPSAAPVASAPLDNPFAATLTGGAPEPPQPESTGSMLARKAGLGTRDVLEGTVGPLYDIARAPINWLGGKIGLPPVQSFGDNLTALGLPQAQTPFERGASSVIQPVAGTLTGQAIGSALTTAANPTLQILGRSLTEQPVTQAISAGVGGATTQATGSPTAGLAAGMVTPFALAGAGKVAGAVENAALGGISKPDAELGRLATQKYNIPIGAPDLTDNAAIRIGTDQMGKLPFSGVRPSTEAKQAAWQGAIAREMGTPDASKFTPDVMSRTATRIGSVFDGVAAHTSIPPAETTQLSTDLDGVVAQAKRVLQPGEIAPLQTQVDDIKQLIADNNGTITGDAYQRLTNAKSALSRLERQNSNTADFASDVRDHLDDAFSRSASPADQDDLQKARYQYRVMRTVDQLAAGSRTGDITPDGFMQKVLTSSRRFDSPLNGMAYTGGGNIGELARIGKLMRAPPQTGTADRAAINLLAAGSIGLPATISSNPAALLGVPAALAANRGAGAYLRSGSLANRLIENAIGPNTPQANPLLRALQTSGVTGAEAEYRNLPNYLNPTGR